MNKTCVIDLIRSKWVCENILTSFVSDEAANRFPIIVQVVEVSAQRKQAWIRWWKSLQTQGCLPALKACFLLLLCCFLTNLNFRFRSRISSARWRRLSTVQLTNSAVAPCTWCCVRRQKAVASLPWWRSTGPRARWPTCWWTASSCRRRSSSEVCSSAVCRAERELASESWTHGWRFLFLKSEFFKLIFWNSLI